MEDVAPDPKQCPEQESGNTAGKVIQQEEQQVGGKQDTGIHFDYYSGLSVETTGNTDNNLGQQEGPPAPLLLNPQGQDGTEESGHQLVK